MIPYADAIQLYRPWVPAEGTASVMEVVDALLADPASQPFIAHCPLPADPIQHHRWVQAALTVRPPMPLSQALCDSTDRLQQQALAAKNITDVSQLQGVHLAGFGDTCISLWQGDITTLRVGAITNAANPQMIGCFQPFHACIDNQIHIAAGPRLRDDCARIIAAQGHDEVPGGARITRAYNLPAEFVLHTVGPIVAHRQPQAEQAWQLASCYRSCLALAAEAGVRSVALCGIATGVYGYPPEQAAPLALDTVSGWLQRHPGCIDQVVFCTWENSATALYREQMERYL